MNNKNIFVDTVSAINVNNGIVKMQLVAQSSEQQATDNDDKPKFDDLGQITMPLNGFLYMLSVIEGLMQDDKMKDMIQRFQTAGIIPTEQDIEKAQKK
ncbi:hypothetical protein BTHERMOSOX_1053 [Bathymodiolus thermophilus thioautotrophic gill symbiont]|jgi:hypothetical protein|uniref:Uncharacterized protein n=1 Tax=Bathymodiolus thermophilus thioautotrophic gill symbiont TaxID=2360 RepID=A0A1J5UHX2_9GAMM|nr:hypothetical protein [Bathymodiolus thermophilus thioautotrophic gill symbiont]AYQ56775.1 hypothetical protein MS2017_1068 [Bathymodiolus thermophilus thioautotrophic gill symbiont]OIR23871.1 hypothetical protein BGC33_08395 [Bathymodiolus thermophilus thioautotrophic gill symbiont]SHA30120.1 hypothetical protein BTHERMOSOX_1053 [Bathymodiolus thermophilus thioautotrophic gill symbiont]